MPAQRVVLTALLVFILTAATSADQPTFTPQAGVVLLRNGQVLHGNITRAGDYFVVTLGPASEIRLKADDVEVACKSIDEAYIYRLQRLNPTNHSQRIALAEWCLRNGMLDHASEQLDLATQQTGDHPQIKSLRERLEFAREKKPDLPSTKARANLATIGADQLEKTLQELPEGSVEKFSAVVQPILLNRCGANQCHGPMSKSPYQLLKPAAGQVANQRYSQRNLYSTLLYVDRDDPLGSSLLMMPQRRHGGSATPVFDERTLNQLEELTAWVTLVTAAQAVQKVPESIDAGGALLTAGPRPQTAGRFDKLPARPDAPQAGTETEFGPDPRHGERATRKEPATQPDAAPTTSNPAAYVPRDAFDPEIFNRRFFRAK